MTADEKVNELADILFQLIGDLGRHGAIPEYKREILWAKIRRFKDAVGDSEST